MDAEAAYLFRHALLRDAAYELQTLTARAILHELALRVIEELFDEAEISTMAEELADHARIAGARHSTSGLDAKKQLAGKEAAYLSQALVAATKRFDHPAVLRLCNRLLEHGSVGAEEKARIGSERGNVLRILGRIGEARDSYEQAAELAEKLGSARYGAKALNSLSALCVLDRRLEQARALREKALELVRRDGTRSELGKALGNIGVLDHAAGAPEKAESAFRNALEIAVETADGDSERLWLTNLAIVLEDLGRTEEAEQSYRRACELAYRLGGAAAAAALANYGASLSARDRPEAEDVLRKALACAKESGLHRWEAVALDGLAGILFKSGRVKEGFAALEKAVRLGLELGESQLTLSFRSHLAHYLAKHERKQEAETQSREVAHLRTRLGLPAE